MEIATMLQSHDLPGWTIPSADGKQPPQHAWPWAQCWRQEGEPGPPAPGLRLLRGSSAAGEVGSQRANAQTLT